MYKYWVFSVSGATIYLVALLKWDSNRISPRPPQSHELYVDQWRKESCSEDASNDEEVAGDAGLGLKLNVVITYSSTVTLPTSLVLTLMGAQMAVSIKMRHLLMVTKGVIPRAHATVGGLMPKGAAIAVTAGSSAAGGCGIMMSIRRRTASARRLLMSATSLLTLVAPTTAPIEAGRRPAKGATATTQARRRTSTGLTCCCGAGAVVGAAMLGVAGVVGMVRAEDLTIVGGALRCVGQYRVGLGEE